MQTGHYVPKAWVPGVPAPTQTWLSKGLLPPRCIPGLEFFRTNLYRKWDDRLPKRKRYICSGTATYSIVAYQRTVMPVDSSSALLTLLYILRLSLNGKSEVSLLGITACAVVRPFWNAQALTLFGSAVKPLFSPSPYGQLRSALLGLVPFSKRLPRVFLALYRFGRVTRASPAARSSRYGGCSVVSTLSLIRLALTKVWRTIAWKFEVARSSVLTVHTSSLLVSD
ncbi:hypothetical protein DFH29DRAFT_960571 [Suillus ampliporus]|nr:hypothetical protein DFH29DRAFT_960571 [Suillus ampliporus]